MKETPSHIPVLTQEVVNLLNLRPGSVIVDATLGAGGHSLAIAEKIGAKGIIIGIDKDANAISIACKNFSQKKTSQLVAIHSSYTAISSIVKDYGYSGVEGILFDLGLSSVQLKTARGFSFLEDVPLDMRFDQSQGLTAAQIINSYSKDKLADILWEFGQERASRRIAKAIFEARRKKKIETTKELVDIIVQAKGGGRGKIHPATLTFQALRIVVNQELEAITEVMPEAIRLLSPQGRLAVISYHSLEDRIIKNIFREAAKAGKVIIITKKPVTASREEIQNNPRARSAKLRVVEKI